MATKSIRHGNSFHEPFCRCLDSPKGVLMDHQKGKTLTVFAIHAGLRVSSICTLGIQTRPGQELNVSCCRAFHEKHPSVRSRCMGLFLPTFLNSTSTIKLAGQNGTASQCIRREEGLFLLKHFRRNTWDNHS